MQDEKTPGVQDAVEALADGKLIAFPTDTVWGLAADASNDLAVAQVFTAKGRPILQPLAVLVPNAGDAEKLAVFNGSARKLAREFWPGALTLVLRRRPRAGLSGLVTAGLATIGVRVPAHPLALEILNAFGKPLAVTSANPSGEASGIDARGVADSLGDALALILDVEPGPGGVESTVVAAEEEALKILRQGAVSIKMLSGVVDIPVTVGDK